MIAKRCMYKKATHNKMYATKVFIRVVCLKVKTTCPKFGIIEVHTKYSLKMHMLQGPPRNLPRSIYAISSIVHPNQTYCRIAR